MSKKPEPFSQTSFRVSIDNSFIHRIKMGKDSVVLDMGRVAHIALYEDALLKRTALKNETPIKLPRLKRNVDVSSPSRTQGGAVATIDLWQLGFKYNMNRALGKNQDLYVVNSQNHSGGTAGGSHGNNPTGSTDKKEKRE